MKIKKPDLSPLSRLFPVGWPWADTLTYAGLGLGVSALAAFALFANRYGRALDALYQWNDSTSQIGSSDWAARDTGDIETCFRSRFSVNKGI